MFHPSMHFLEPPRLEMVDPLPALRLRANQRSFQQDLKLLRYRGLAHREPAGNLGGRLWPGFQQFENRPPGVIRDGLINEIRVRFAQQPRLYKNVLMRQEGIWIGSLQYAATICTRGPLQVLFWREREDELFRCVSGGAGVSNLDIYATERTEFALYGAFSSR